MAGPWAVVIHGGAGVMSKSLDSLLFPLAQYHAALTLAASAAGNILRAGGSAFDAAVEAVAVMEDAEVFNAGRGSVLTSAGKVEMEAAVMDGPTRRAGSVIGLTTTKNPVRAAAAVSQRSPHSVLAWHSAEQFSKDCGLEQRDPEYFIVPERRKQLAEASSACILDHETGAGAPAPSNDRTGTVGAVCCDMQGRVAAASSTGGMCNKWPGRVGDTPLIGCGTFAAPHVAVAATGRGEAFIAQASTARVAYDMALCGTELQAAVTAAVAALEVDDGGLIAVDARGNWALGFNTAGMFRAVLTPAMDSPCVGIWADGDEAPHA